MLEQKKERRGRAREMFVDFCLNSRQIATGFIRDSKRCTRPLGAEYNSRFTVALYRRTIRECTHRRSRALPVAFTANIGHKRAMAISQIG